MVIQMDGRKVNQTRIRRIVQRIPVFKGLSPEHLAKLSKVCAVRVYKADQVVCREEEKSSELFVILSGYLRITSAVGVEIALIKPMGVVGEMGVLTGRPRSATVIAAEDTQVLCISKVQLDRLIQADKDIGLQIYRNFIDMLCDRLRDNNIFLEQYYLIIEDMMGEPPE